MQKIPVLIVGGVLVQAYQYYGTLMPGKGKTISDLAQDAHVSSSYFTQALRLSFLARRS